MAVQHTLGSRAFQQATRKRGEVARLAPLTGCDASYLYHLRAGRRRPGLELAMRIETLLAIPARAWTMPAPTTAVAA